LNRSALRASHGTTTFQITCSARRCLSSSRRRASAAHNRAQASRRRQPAMRTAAARIATCVRNRHHHAIDATPTRRKILISTQMAT
jgi:hypothetical protein